MKLEDAFAEELLLAQDALEDLSALTLQSVTLQPHVVTVALAALAARVRSNPPGIAVVVRFLVTRFVRFLF